MPSVPERVREIFEEIRSRLDLDEEQFVDLASVTNQKYTHQTGAWEPGQSVPSDDKKGWAVLAVMSTNPFDDEGQESAEYTMGDVRAYVVADVDQLGPLRDRVLIPGQDMYFGMFRLHADGRLLKQPMTQEQLVDALCDEFEYVLDEAGMGEADWTCPSCKKVNHDTMLLPEDADDDDEPPQASFCAGCGAARVEVVPAAGQH